MKHFLSFFLPSFLLQYSSIRNNIFNPPIWTITILPGYNFLCQNFSYPATVLRASLPTDIYGKFGFSFIFGHQGVFYPFDSTYGLIRPGVISFLKHNIPWTALYLIFFWRNISNGYLFLPVRVLSLLRIFSTTALTYRRFNNFNLLF